MLEALVFDIFSLYFKARFKAVIFTALNLVLKGS